MINNPKNLMMSISNCDEVERAKEDSNHPCYKIVHYQYIENQYFKNKKIIYAPHPSRWCYIGKDFEIKELIMNQL